MTASAKLYIVRLEDYSEYGYQPPKESGPFGMEAAFATREQAVAFMHERDEALRKRGDREPLLCLTSGLDALMELSAFDPPVFLDWLVDHDIPLPLDRSALSRGEPDGLADDFDYTPRLRHPSASRYERWLLSLDRRQLIDLYAALHHLHFYRIDEIPFIQGEYPPEQWAQWEHQALLAEPAPPPWAEAEAELIAEGWQPLLDGPPADGQPTYWNEDEIPF
jgi:hypothetical protein